MQAINPTTTSAWSRLVELSKKHQTSTITALFDQKNRFERYSRSLEDILVDFSKNRISDEVFEELLNLARETALQEAISSMFEGQAINQTENRPVLHTALRNRSNTPIFVNPMVKIAKPNCASPVSFSEIAGYFLRMFTNPVTINFFSSLVNSMAFLKPIL